MLSIAGTGAAGATAARPGCAAAIAAAVSAEWAGTNPAQLANANPTGPAIGPARTALMQGQ